MISLAICVQFFWSNASDFRICLLFRQPLTVLQRFAWAYNSLGFPQPETALQLMRKGVDKEGLWGLKLLSFFYEIITNVDNSSLKLNLQFKFRFKYNFIRVTRKCHYRYKLFKVS